MLGFNHARLTAALQELPAPTRATFAALCADRLVSASIATGPLAQDAKRELLDLRELLWAGLLGPPPSASALSEGEARAFALLPPEEANQPLLDDTAAALTYAFRCLRSGGAAEAAWAAQRVSDAVDAFLQEQGVEGNERLLTHPLYQAELQRQEDDLSTLRDASPRDNPRWDSLRRRADLQGSQLFGGPKPAKCSTNGITNCCT